MTRETTHIPEFHIGDLLERHYPDGKFDRVLILSDPYEDFESEMRINKKPVKKATFVDVLVLVDSRNDETNEKTVWVPADLDHFKVVASFS